MGSIFVARSPRLSDWASDVGLSKNIFKLGYVEDPEADPLQAWCGEDDWVIVTSVQAELDDETVLFERIARKEKQIDPNFYPRLKGTPGVFKVAQQSVENHILVSKALEGEINQALAKKALRPKPADFASYLLALAQRG